MRTTMDDQEPLAFDGVLAWSIRQERMLCQRLEELQAEGDALRAYEAKRAQLCWDEDRRCEAEELGETLRKKPASVRARLARTRHGAGWLIDRWKALGAILERGSTWTEAQSSMAFDLLGVDPTLRSGDPWTAAGLQTPRALVDREIRGLEASLARTLDSLDEIERAEAIAGNPVRPSTARLRLRREETACWRRLLKMQETIAEESARLLEMAEPVPAPVSPRDDRPPAPTAPPPTPARPEPARLVQVASLSPAPQGNRRARRAAQSLRRQEARPLRAVEVDRRERPRLGR